MSLFSDIVALAKAGYTPAEVKELMQMNIDNIEAQKPTCSSTETDAPADQEASARPSETPDTSAAGASESDKTPEPQPDPLTEALKAENEKLKADLMAAQKANTGRDLSTKGSSDDTLTDIVRSFM